MGLFSKLFGGRQDLNGQQTLGRQPHKDWPWTLSVNGEVTSNVSWDDIVQALNSLGPRDDSFVILEQKQGKDYWFIQSAVALAGPLMGEYIVGVGWNDSRRKYLVERCGGVGMAVELFWTVWEGNTLDFTGFEDKSDMLDF